MSSRSVHDDRHLSFAGSPRYGGGDEADSDDRKTLTLTRPLNSSLFVRNVADRATNDDLRNLFRQFGPLFDVYIPRDFHSKRPRGFAYVQFECAEDAAEAQDKLHHANLFGRSLEVDFAKGDRKTPYEMKAQELEDPDAAFGRPSRHRHHGVHHHHHHGDQHHHRHEHRHSSRSYRHHHHHHHHHHRSRSGEKRHRHRDHRHGSGDRNHREHRHRSGDQNHRHRHRHHSHSDHDRHNHTVKRSRSGRMKRRSQSRERGTAEVQDRPRPVSSSGRRRERRRSSSSSGSASTDRSASPTPPSTPRSSPRPSTRVFEDRDLDSPSGLPVSDAPVDGVRAGARNASGDEEPFQRLSSVGENDVQCNWSDEPAPPGES